MEMVESVAQDDGSLVGGYPERPGEQECSYYMKTGTCKYATKCKFHHPPDVTPSWGAVSPATDVTIGLNKESYPRRPGEQQCTFFLKTGTCKYKMSCKFDHPPEAIQQTLQLQSTPYPVRPGELQCAYYIKTGKCKFGATCRFDHPPLPPEQAQNMMNYYPPHPDQAMMGVMPPQAPAHQLGFPPPQLAQRPGEKECTFFLRTGRCQYGPRCKFHHPVEKLAGNLAALNGMGMAPMPFPGPGMPGHPVEAYPGYQQQHMQMRGPPPPQVAAPEAPLPSRPGQEVCSFYMRTGKCSYGASCRFDHPRNIGPSRDSSGGSESGGASNGSSGNNMQGSGGEGGQGGSGPQGQQSSNYGGPSQGGNSEGGGFQQHHMQYNMQVNGNGGQYPGPQQGQYPPLGPDQYPQGGNGVQHMYQAGAEYGSPQGFMYPQHHPGVQYAPAGQAAVYAAPPNYRQSS